MKQIHKIAFCGVFTGSTVALSKCKSYCVSFKLETVEMAEKKSKEAAVREFSVDPKRMREYRTLVLL